MLACIQGVAVEGTEDILVVAGRWTMWESLFWRLPSAILSASFPRPACSRRNSIRDVERIFDVDLLKNRIAHRPCLLGHPKGRRPAHSLARACRPRISSSWSVPMLPSSTSLETVAERADALRSTLGSMYLEGFVHPGQPPDHRRTHAIGTLVGRCRHTPLSKESPTSSALAMAGLPLPQNFRILFRSVSSTSITSDRTA